jgi:DNA gyrase subunit A
MEHAHVLIDKQGNFGSIAGLPPAAMRYTEARLSPIAAMMLDDSSSTRSTTCRPTTSANTEPTVLPSEVPQPAGQRAQRHRRRHGDQIPPHNLREICDALIRVIDEPDVSIDELLEIVPGPDFPTGGIICGRSGIRRGYLTGRSTIVLRARARSKSTRRTAIGSSFRRSPTSSSATGVIEKIAALVNDDRIKASAKSPTRAT